MEANTTESDDDRWATAALQSLLCRLLTRIANDYLEAALAAKR